MREIKFRAWDKDIKKMCEVIHLDMYLDCVEIDADPEHNVSLRELFYPSDCILMQFTGLKDKNGKGQDTYHQDILKINDGFSGDHFEKGGNFTIEWVDDGWAVVDRDGEYFSSLWEVIYNRGAEVIGNIYQDKELLSISPEKPSD